MPKPGKIGTFYHFTSQNNLSLIQQAGVITTTESNVGSSRADMPPFGEHVGPDVVWLLDVPELEFEHGLPRSSGNKREVRFTVRCRAIRWLDWHPAKRMHPAWRARMIEAAGGMDAARHWWVSERPIARADWSAVDIVPAERVA
ncbi:hypothetical protein ACI8AV_18095 [Geodermatophilus sp. SYSU D00804]